MSLLALIAALVLEQAHPLSSRKYLSGWLHSYINFFQLHFNAGEHWHGRIAWLAAVLPPVALTVIVYWLLYRLHPIFGWAFNVVVLYLTMGFRQFSHYFTDIHLALRGGRLEQARGLLSRWIDIPFHESNAEEVARVAIEQALISSHRTVFGVMAWFVVFSILGLGGAGGALLYRMGQFLYKHWAGEVGALGGSIIREFPVSSNKVRSSPLSCHGSAHDPIRSGEFGTFARQAFHLLDWLPVRLTAMTFAIVGDFEDTVYCWRAQAGNWPDPEVGILLASGAGALGVRLGMPLPRSGLLEDRPEIGIGDSADADFMQSAVGLVWRSVVLWMILILLLTLANLPT